MENRKSFDKGGNHYWGILDYFKLNSKLSQELNELFHTPAFQLDTSTISSRVLNHWENLGLIQPFRQGTGGWRKFSLIEIIWIFIIVNLRELGFPLERILKVREFLSKSIYVNPDTPFPDLEYYCFLCLYKKYPCYILIFNNGQSELVTYPEYLTYLNSQTMFSKNDSYTTIPLNHLLESFFEDDAKPESALGIHVSKEEAELIIQLRDSKNKSVAVEKDKNGLHQLKITKIEDVKSNIMQMVSHSENQDIVIKVRNGKRVDIRREVIKRNKN